MRGPKPKPVYAFKDGQFFQSFASANDAALALGLKNANQIRLAINKHGICHGFVWSYTKRISGKDLLQDDRRKPGKTYTAEIEGVTFNSVFNEDKKSCTACDIFKMQPPRNMGQAPLCYDYSCGNRRIVQLCQSFRILWKKAQNNQQ